MRENRFGASEETPSTLIALESLHFRLFEASDRALPQNWHAPCKDGCVGQF
jgi:hypothetical protein